MLQPNYVWSRPIKWFRFRPKITIVTYAHSPQALELTPKVIKKAKNIFKNSLLVRFEHLYKSLILLVFHFLEQKTSIRNYIKNTTDDKKKFAQLKIKDIGQ